MPKKKSVVPNVLIVVSGGLVVDVMTDGNVNFNILDWDNINAGDKFDPDYTKMERNNKKMKAAVKEAIAKNTQDADVSVQAKAD